MRLDRVKYDGKELMAFVACEQAGIQFRLYELTRKLDKVDPQTAFDKVVKYAKKNKGYYDDTLSPIQITDPKTGDQAVVYFKHACEMYMADLTLVREWHKKNPDKPWEDAIKRYGKTHGWTDPEHHGFEKCKWYANKQEEKEYQKKDRIEKETTKAMIVPLGEGILRTEKLADVKKQQEKVQMLLEKREKLQLEKLQKEGQYKDLERKIAHLETATANLKIETGNIKKRNYHLTKKLEKVASEASEAAQKLLADNDHLQEKSKEITDSKKS